MNENVSINFSRRIRRFGVRTSTFIQTKGKQNMIIILALIVLMALFYALNPSFLESYNIVSMAQSLAPYAIMGLGVTFVIATGGIDLSIGTVCIASAVIAGKLYMGGMPLWATIPVMIAIGAVFGLLNGFLVAKLKLPAFIATLGTMMLARGLSAILVSIPNIFFPNGTWFNAVFSSANSIPTGLFWVIGFMILCMYLMYKNKIGRYILSIGSNEEATRLSGINTVKYKMIAYTISGLGAGIAAIFWAASFATVAAATGNGMELDAIAGVYIGGTSAAGGVASIFGSVVGGLMLVVIRSGLNFVLARLSFNVSATYVTYVLTGIIVVVAVLMDVLKNVRASKVGKRTDIKNLRQRTAHMIEEKRREQDVILSDRKLKETERRERFQAIEQEITAIRTVRDEKIAALRQEIRDSKNIDKSSK